MEMIRYKVIRLRGVMVGYDYAVYDLQDDNMIVWPDGRSYSDDLSEAERLAESLNANTPATAPGGTDSDL